MKKILVKGLSLLLAGVMVFSLASCGKKDGQGSNGGSKTENGTSGNASTDAKYDDSKYGVFRETDLNFGIEADDISFYTLKVVKDKVCAIARVYDYSECSDYYQSYKYISMNLDGSNPTVTDIAFWNNNEDSYTGAEILLSELIAIEDPVIEDEYYDGEYYDEDCYGDDYSYDNYYINNALLDDEGNGYCILNHSASSYCDDVYDYYEENSLVSFDPTGVIRWSVPFDYLNNDDEWRYIQSAFVLDGKLNILMGGDRTMLFVYDENGNIENRGELALPEKVTMNFSNLFLLGDKTYATYYDENWDHLFYAECDLKAGTVGKEYEIPATDVYMGFSYPFSGLGYDICFSNSRGIFGMNIGDTESKLVMSYVNSDVDTYNLSYATPIDENSFVASYYNNDYQYTVASFTKVEPKDVPDKKVLVLAAASSLDSSIKSRIIKENKTNPEYRIVIKEYSDYASYDDYEAGVTRLKNDLISGEIPDILISSSYDSINYDSLNAKGLFVDLDEMLKNDPETSKNEYVPGVLNALRYNGTLYQIAPKFSVSTIVGKGSMLNGMTRWNMSQFIEASKNLKDGQSMFGSITRDSFMYDVMNYCGSDFIDVKTGKCNFDSADFKAILEYAKSLPEDLNYDDDYWQNYWATYETQYRDERVALMELGLYYFSDINYNFGGYFGGDAVLIGFPSSTGNGGYFNVNNMFSISAKSQYKDEAWNFVKYYLLDEYQRSDNWTLPILKSALVESAYAATEKPYYMDENDQKIEYNYTFWLGDDSVEYEPISKATADEIVDYICNISTINGTSSAITDIINEEAAAYFSGQKSVDDVANIIQSRVKVYVNENM